LQNAFDENIILLLGKMLNPPLERFHKITALRVFLLKTELSRKGYMTSTCGSVSGRN
jgi:hypothetical protein